MAITLPYTFANGAGNKPDAEKWNSNNWYLLALMFGNFIKNPGLEFWDTTSFSNPSTGATIANNWLWRKSGTSSPTADVAREASTVDSGSYSGKITISGAGSSNSLAAFDQTINAYSILSSGAHTVVFGASVRVSTASKVRLKIDDGVASQYSDYHTGGGTFEVLRVARTVSGSATGITVSIEVTSDFTGSIYIDSTFLYVTPSNISTVGKTNLVYIPFAELSPMSGNGNVLYSPNGTAYRLSISNDGALTTEAL